MGRGPARVFFFVFSGGFGTFLAASFSVANSFGSYSYYVTTLGSIICMSLSRWHDMGDELPVTPVHLFSQDF